MYQEQKYIALFKSQGFLVMWKFMWNAWGKSAEINGSIPERMLVKNRYNSITKSPKFSKGRLCLRHHRRQWMTGFVTTRASAPAGEGRGDELLQPLRPIGVGLLHGRAPTVEARWKLTNTWESCSSRWDATANPDPSQTRREWRWEGRVRSSPGSLHRSKPCKR